MSDRKVTAGDYHLIRNDSLWIMAQSLRDVTTLRLLLLLTGHLCWTEWHPLDPSDLAIELWSDPSNAQAIAPHLDELVQIGAIINRNVGAEVEWKLSAEWGWRGDPADWAAAEAAERAPRLCWWKSLSHVERQHWRSVAGEAGVGPAWQAYLRLHPPKPPEHAAAAGLPPS